MKLQFRDIAAFVKKPPANMQAVLVYGPDEGLIRERAMMMMKAQGIDEKDPFAIAEFSGDQLTENPSKILDEAQSISMLGGRRVVRVRDVGDKAETIIKDLLKALKPGGRLAVITFHSLEDRIVKNIFRDAEALGRPVYKKVVVPSQEELDINSRSRSAKLRVFERSAQDELREL